MNQEIENKRKSTLPKNNINAVNIYLKLKNSSNLEDKDNFDKINKVKKNDFIIDEALKVEEEEVYVSDITNNSLITNNVNIDQTNNNQIDIKQSTETPDPTNTDSINSLGMVNFISVPTIPTVKKQENANNKIPIVPGIPSIPLIPAIPIVPIVPTMNKSIPSIPGIPNKAVIPPVDNTMVTEGIPLIPNIPNLAKFNSVPNVVNMNLLNTIPVKRKIFS